MRKQLSVFILTLFALLTFGLGGCAILGNSNNLKAAGQFGINAMSLASQVITVEPEVQHAEDMIQAKLSQFPPAQQAKLKQAKTSINAAQTDVNGIISGANGAAKVLVSLSQVESVYRNAKYAYISARSVIAQHMKDFTPVQRAKLKQLDADAKQLNKDMAALQSTKTASNVNVNQVLTTALTIASTGAKIAIMAGA